MPPDALNFIDADIVEKLASTSRWLFKIDRKRVFFVGKSPVSNASTGHPRKRLSLLAFTGATLFSTMPAPKKDQFLKDQTRRRKEVRKYRKACRAALGPLGTRAFREFLNLHGRLPIETTACWAEALARVYGAQGTALAGKKAAKLSRLDLKKYRGQFGGWSQALLRRKLALPMVAGLRFAMRILEVEGDVPRPWRARLFILYEQQCGVVFHYLKSISSPDRQNGALVWEVLNQAVSQLVYCRWPYFHPKEAETLPLSVAFPVKANGRFSHPLLDDAIIRQNDSDSVSWQVTAFRGLRPSRLKIGKTSFSDLHWALRRQSRKVSAALRALRPRRYPVITEKILESGAPGRPAWLLLFPDEYPYDFQSYA